MFKKFNSILYLEYFYRFVVKHLSHYFDDINFVFETSHFLFSSNFIMQGVTVTKRLESRLRS